MKKGGKKGLSTIVVTLIIILVSLVAVGIIWIVVRNVIQRGAEGVSMGQFTLSAKIMNVNLENASNSNNVNLTVKRNPGEGAFTGLKFIFYDGKDSEVITQTVSLDELEEKRFNFHLNILNVSQLVSISIVPIFNQNGKETIGNVLDKYTIRGSEQHQFVCSPNTCSGLGYTCGTWANGTCSGTLNCGNCSGGYICGSGGTCVSSCTPSASCSALGYTCGTWANGTCSGNLNCGTCGTGYSCNASGRCMVNISGNVSGNFRYVRAGATGSNNGSDWTNAFTDIPDFPQRNTTYWLADGTYTSMDWLNEPGGTGKIIVKKATISEHEDNTGWSNTYGDGQAVISGGGITIYIDDVTIDGTTRSSSTSGHGIKINPSLNSAGVKLTNWNNFADNFTIKYCELVGAGPYGDTASAIYVPGNGLVMQYNYIHDWGIVHILMSDRDNAVIEYNHFARQGSGAAHGEPFSAYHVNDVVFRYNYVEDAAGTAFIFVRTDPNTVITRNWSIYGNVFWFNPGWHNQGWQVSSWIWISTAAQNFNIYNNVIYNAEGVGQDIKVYSGGAYEGTTQQPVDIRAYNNMWWNCEHLDQTYAGNGFVYDYNFYYNTSRSISIPEPNQQVWTGGNIFVDPADANFHLNQPTAAGTSLPYPFNTDMDGNIRGSDGTWDRGAYEYV